MVVFVMNGWIEHGRIVSIFREQVKMVLTHQMLLIWDNVGSGSDSLSVNPNESFAGVLSRPLCDSFWTQCCRIVEGQVGVTCK